MVFGGVSTVRINTNVVGKEAVGRNSFRPRLFGGVGGGERGRGRRNTKESTKAVEGGGANRVRAHGSMTWQRFLKSRLNPDFNCFLIQF